MTIRRPPVVIVALCALLALSFLACGKKKEAPPKTGGAAAAGDIVDVMSGDGKLTTFVSALNAAGLAGTLKGKGPFTVFAPVDSAFAKLPPGTIESLYQEVPTLKRLLLMHVVPGNLTAADVRGMKVVGTLSGASVRIMDMPGGAIMVGDGTIVIADVPATNGVIHVIDRVLLPPSEP
jgi:uncharacterized surface protein with fasciclin (FAS1) repeats